MRFAAILVAVLLVAGCGAYFYFDTDPAATASPISYDDYIEFSEFSGTPVSAEGSFSLTTVGGVDYVHASDVGEGIITYEDGSVETHDVVKAKLDVYMIIGQSNGSYTSSRADPSQVEGLKPGTAYYYGTTARPSSIADVGNAIHSMVNDNGTAKIGGLEGPLASRLVEAIGNKVLTVNVSIGGTPISSWLPAQSSYLSAQTTFADALSKIDTDRFDYTVRDYIWLQGEADTGTNVQWYVNAFNAMHNSLTGTVRTAFSDHPFQHAFIVKTRAVNGVNSSAAQLLLPDDVTIFLASIVTDTFSNANGLLNGDDLHYTQSAHVLIAQDVAETIKQVRT